VNLNAACTLRLSSRRFHDVSTSEISSQMVSRKKPLKTARSQGLETWLRVQDLNLRPSGYQEKLKFQIYK
jgi:hypothetical protein